MTAAVRTRFAPSPTGDLHVGGARTALFNKLFAMHHKGEFILRIEDTDAKRSEKAFEDSILADMRWLGLQWDFGPMRQSERLSSYKELSDKLLANGLAYRCYCTKERLEELKIAQIKANIPPGYDGRCRKPGEAKIDRSAAPVIRFKVPKKTIAFADGVHGEVSFDARLISDFIIMGSDGIPAYNFAASADDADMRITHVIRGDDHLANTPRQIMLFEAFGFTPPSFFHVPLVLGKDRTPLSKRDRHGSMRTLKEDGYLPEAIINSIARLGWTPPIDKTGAHLLNMKDLAAAFDGTHLSKSASIFETERIKAYNKEAIAASPNERLLTLAGIEAPNADELIGAIKASAETVADMARLISPFISDATPDEEALAILNEPYAKSVILAFSSELKHAPLEIDKEAYDAVIAKVKAATNEKGKRLFMPIRLALTGQGEGIELINILRLLGNTKALERLTKYAD